MTTRTVPIGPPEPHPRTVLLVEDDDLLRPALRATLEFAGYTVAEAGNGLEAIELLHELRPGLIAFDVEMPHMDGIAFARELHHQALRNGAKLLAISGIEELPELAGQLGVDGYLAKPFSVRALTQTVGHLLADRARPVANP